MAWKPTHRLKLEMQTGDNAWTVTFGDIDPDFTAEECERVRELRHPNYRTETLVQHAGITKVGEGSQAPFAIAV